MKHFIFALILLHCQTSIFCQSQNTSLKKPPLQLSDLGKWPSVSSISISGDGKYVIYSINNPETSTNSFFAKSLNEEWELDMGSSSCQFTSDSRYVINKKGKDSLMLIQLNNKEQEYIPNVSSFKISNDGKWLAYIDNQKRLTIRNLKEKKEQSLETVNDYIFNPSDNSLLIETNQANKSQLLLVTNFNSGTTKEIWHAQADEKAGNYVFSKDGKRLAFIVKNKSEKKSIWIFTDGNDSAIEIGRKHLMDISGELLLSKINYRGFTDDGNKLFVELKEKSDMNSDIRGVDVWSYFDKKLQSAQLKQLGPKNYLGIISIPNDQLIQVEHSDDKLISFTSNYAIVANGGDEITSNEWWWNKLVRSSVCLLCLNNGTRKVISDDLPSFLPFYYWLSPGEKYVIYYDAVEKNYFSYEIGSGIKRNITKGINAQWIRYDKRDIKMSKFIPINCTKNSWLKNDKAVILYSQCDVFQVDPAGKSSAINLTNDFGRKNNIEFRFAIENSQCFTGDEFIILSAFSRRTKFDGFYKVRLGENKSPELLITGSARYKGTWEDERFAPTYPIKAKYAETYLVSRMTASEAPNYFWTNDFKKFNKVTDLHPQRNFNWLKAELVNWKTDDGKDFQGILYKPEDFDSSKKYPVIFHYYERMTEALNAFIYPDFSHGELNIPYFVSNGYLVFTPDIWFTEGHPGNSVLNTVISSMQYLSNRPYVDSKHIGLQGHSRGGWETNYIITHTNLFAAAVSACGMSDYVSLYNRIRSLSNGESGQTAFEISYQRIGATLWDKPELYIENSPIFRVNKIVTPLLMMANKEDNDVPFEQGIEFFTALRRLGKKAWMLQYDGAKHMVFDESAMDFTIRMKQFYDHYLKNINKPKWMMGVSAKDKGKVNLNEFVSEK